MQGYTSLAGPIAERKRHARKGAHFCIELAPRPRLEPGTHGLTASNLIFELISY